MSRRPIPPARALAMLAVLALLATAGSRWRAYGRYHQSLCQDDDWSERLLARDFAQAYEEQVRLISTLYTEHQG